MPILVFKCPQCNSEKRRLSYKMKEQEMECTECAVRMNKVLGSPADPIICEKADPYRNKQIRKDLDAIMKARSKKHFTEVELEGLVDEHGEIHARGNKWLRKDGKVKKFEDYT